MDIQFYFSMKEISAGAWNALWPTEYPFTQHGFLSALEESSSVNGESGWQSLFICAQDNDRLIAAMPLYLKMHSYGEYVFDWSWAGAYEQAGLNYYPKLINAIPFTPSTGQRIGFLPELDEQMRSNVFSTFISFIKQYAVEKRLSGFHCLFPNKECVPYWQNEKFYCREGYQFHWFNDHDGKAFTSFNDFLSTFSSRKRKTIKKERKKIPDQNIHIVMKEAHEMSEEEWDIFYALYHRTYLKRSGSAGYLGKDFFHRVAEALPTQVLVACAYHESEFIAAALYFRDETTLYGRYWGTKVDIDGLHFEACYYQGIEYAIANGLKRFDPGAQGEHKIQRGFTPIKTVSYHWLAHPGFNQAIEQFVVEEAKHVGAYLEDARGFLPFKEGVELVDVNCLVDV